MSAKGSLIDSSFNLEYITCECGKTFPSENDLETHLAIEHPHKRERKEFKCGVCGSTFKTEEGCITHYEQNHITNDDVKEEHLDDDSEDTKPDVKPDLAKLDVEVYADDEYKYHVEITNCVEVTEEELVNEKAMTEEVVMGYAEEGDQVSSIPEDSGHARQNQDCKLEPLVKKQRVRSKNAKNMATESRNNSNDSKNHNFAAVNEYLQKENLKKGLPSKSNKSSQSKHEELNGSQEVDEATPKKKKIKERVCEDCGNHYSSSAALMYHKRVHTGEKPYACDFCPKKFTRPIFLKIHVRTHTGERPYPCPHCPKAFYNNAGMHRHIRIHTGERPYSCPMCSKTFTQSNALKLHVTAVHLMQPTYKSKKRKLKAEQSEKNKGVMLRNE